MAERTLVALHGNFASAAWWLELLRDPPAGWRVLSPNLPGFAGTTPPAEVSIPSYAEWLAGWLDRQGVASAVLLGHSLGGAVALQLAARHRARVEGLVLAASAPLGGLVTPEENYPVLELMRVKPELLELSLAALFPSARPANFAQLVADGGRMAASQYSGNARALSCWQVSPADLKGIPALVLGGSEDKLISPEMVRAQASALGSQSVLFQGRGHGFPQEDPAGFRAELEAFLKTLPNERLVPEYTSGDSTQEVQ